MHGLAWVSHALGGGFKEDLWPLGLIHTVIKGATAGVLALLHTGGAAAPVGDACGPDLLAADGGQQCVWGGACDGGVGGGDLLQISVEIRVIKEGVPV